MEVKPTDGSVGIESLQKKSNVQGTGGDGFTKTHKIVILSIVAMFITGGILFVLGKSIYDKGYSAGLEKGKKEATSAGLLSNIANPFQTVSGRVVEVKDDKITIVTMKGENKTVNISKSTKVTKKTTTLAVSDIKKDQKVTIFLQGKDANVTATRIVLSD